MLERLCHNQDALRAAVEELAKMGSVRALVKQQANQQQAIEYAYASLGTDITVLRIHLEHSQLTQRFTRIDQRTKIFRGAGRSTSIEAVAAHR